MGDYFRDVANSIGDEKIESSPRADVIVKKVIPKIEKRSGVGGLITLMVLVIFCISAVNCLCVTK